VSATTTSATPTRTGARNSALVTYLFTVIMAGTTLPTPLYAIYSAHLALSPFMITVIYAVYAVGVLATLQLFGRLSDHAGRRGVLVAAIALSAVSAVIFMTTEDLPALFAGRLVSGVSAGLVTGSATAYLTELEARRTRHGRGRSRAALLSTVANMGGLGLGPLVAGVLADHVAHPTVLPFVADLALLVPVVLVALLRLPETVDERDGWLAGTGLQRIGVPAEIRLPFIAAALAGVAAFALLGFSTSLVGQLLSSALHNHSHQTAGVVAFLIFLAATAAQVVAGALGAQVATTAGLVLLPVGSFVLVLAAHASSLPLVVLGVLIGGFGVGLAFRSAVSSVTELAPADQRAQVISTFFLAAYVGITVPVVAAGVLVTSTSLLVAMTSLAIFIAALSLTAGLIVARIQRAGTASADNLSR
jgi:MFS family permease